MDIDPAGLIIGIFFSTIGFGAFRYGRKTDKVRPMILGLLLMGYSWVVDDALLSGALGAALTLFLFWPR
jgi:hypothetical protein